LGLVAARSIGWRHFLTSLGPNLNQSLNPEPAATVNMATANTEAPMERFPLDEI